MDDRLNVVVVGDRARNKADVMARARKAATGFLTEGVRANDAVALLLRNDFAFLEATQAASLIGAYAVPLNWHAAPDEVAYMLQDSKPRLLVAHADLISAVRHVVPDDIFLLTVPSDDDALLLEDVRLWDDWLAAFQEYDEPAKPPRSSWIYTSGTTGRPKGVRREPANPGQAAATRGHRRGRGQQPAGF